jgi:hypothetical protein
MCYSTACQNGTKMGAYMNMNPFKSFKLNWWEAASLIVGTLAAGIAIGTQSHVHFIDYRPALIIIAVIGVAYYAYVWAKQ